MSRTFDLPTEPAPDFQGSLLLFKRARDGNRAALNELLNRYRLRLERWVASQLGPRLRSRVDVEDILQMTLEHAWRDMPNFVPRGHRELFAWFRRIALHRILDESEKWRTKKRDTARESELKRSVSAAYESLGRRIHETEAHAALMMAIASLSEEHREVIRLIRLEGLSYDEAAEIIGISRSATSVRLVRAMRALRACFPDGDPSSSA